MASLVLGVAGAALAPTGFAAVGYMIGSALGAALFPPPGQDGPRITDLKVQASQYGSMIPIVYNTCRVAGTVIWASEMTETKHTSGGGKGGGGGESTTYTYSCSFATSICEGTRTIKKIWADGKLLWDNGITHFKASSFVIYTGTESQEPDPTIETDLGAGNVPAYRGQCYCVFANLELEKFGNRIPNLTFEIAPVDVSEYLNVGQILRDISYRVGLVEEQINVSEIIDGITGYVIANRMTGRSAMEPLCKAFFFDVVESSGKVKFVRRGVGTVVSISSDEIVMATLS